MNLPASRLIAHSILFICLTVWVSTNGQATLCEGSLGDNIFEEGDFGSGRDVIMRKDPGYAPGYQYTVRTPLPDGYYTITNSIGRWMDNWPTWLPLKDNSDDYNGYMMVVNASYQPGIFYEQVIDGVCENTLYEFSADVINVVARRVRDHIYPNVSFLIDGEVRYNTGRIRQDEQWHNVGFTFMTYPGQTEVRLTLRNNAPGGTGNDLALDNISFRACGPYASISTNASDVICQSDDFPVLTADIQSSQRRYVEWQVRKKGESDWSSTGLGSNEEYQVEKLDPGKYEFRFVHAATPGNLMSDKCRAASDVLSLEVLASEYVKDVYLEAGETLQFGDRTISEAGTYEQRFYNAIGCDSVVVLTVTMPEPELPAPVEEAVVLAAPAPPPPPVEEVKLGPPPIATIIEEKPVSCPGRADAELSVLIDGGSEPFQFAWSSGSSSSSLTNIGAGLYVVTITDADNRIATSSIRLKESTGPDIEVTDIQGVVQGMTNGSARVEVRTASTELSIRWDNGESGREAQNLSQGAHSVTITDDSGCSVTETFEIPERILEQLTVEALESGAAIRMDRLQFEADSSTIKKESIPSLDELYQFLKDNPDMVIEIGGHTNGLPEHDYCDRLSKARAKAVAVWIVDKGIEAERVFYKGYGKRKPIASNQTPDGRRKNQRVEVRMLTIKD